MGYTTDFIGHIEIRPPLNEAEQLYLTAFSQSRRCERTAGPYDVPRNPAAERGERPADLDGYNTIALGQPSLWCGWVPSWGGCGFSHDGVEKFYGASAWLTYLIDHFLAPGAFAALSGLDWFEGFSFDHVLDGTVAACCRDTRELYLIHVQRNLVRVKTITPPQPEFFDADPLPYEVAIDKAAARRRRRDAGRPRRRA